MHKNPHLRPAIQKKSGSQQPFFLHRPIRGIYIKIETQCPKLLYFFNVLQNYHQHERMSPDKAVSPWRPGKLRHADRFASASLRTVAAFAVCIFARMCLPVSKLPPDNSAQMRMAQIYAQNRKKFLDGLTFL